MSDFVSSVGQGLSDFGSSVGNVVSDVGQGISNVVSNIGTGLASVDKAVGSSVPGGWGTLAGLAAAPLTGGASMSEMMAADAADLARQGIGQEQIAQIMAQSYGVDSMVAADVAGLASQGIPASQLASTLAQSYPDIMGTVSNAAASGSGGLQNLLGYAKTGSQIIGGLGKVAGGIAGLTSGGKVNPQQADPFSQYRSGLASQLNNLLQDPNTVTSTPGYQFNLSQGLQAQQAQQAAQGRLVSGGALLQGQQYGQQLASQTYQQQLANLASLSGATQSPGTGATAQQNVGLSNTANLFGGINSIAQGLGVASGLSPLDTLYSNYNKSSPSADIQRS
jgi:hypothetical protein